MAPRLADTYFPQERFGPARTPSKHSRRKRLARLEHASCPALAVSLSPEVCHGRDQPVRSTLRTYPRGRTLARRVPGRMQAQPPGVCHGAGTHAQGHRRAAVDRHAQRPAHVAVVRQQGHQDLSRVRRVLRHGGRDRAGRLLLPPCGAGPGGKEADPLPAGPGGRRQELDRRAAEVADGAGAVLRDQGFAGQRIAAGPVQRDRGRRGPGERVRHPAPLPQPHHVAVGREAARGVRRRHPQVQGRQAPPVHPQAGGHQQDGAG